jgi:hypothetical protein
MLLAAGWQGKLECYGVSTASDGDQVSIETQGIELAGSDDQVASAPCTNLTLCRLCPTNLFRPARCRH